MKEKNLHSSLALIHFSSVFTATIPSSSSSSLSSSRVMPSLLWGFALGLLGIASYFFLFNKSSDSSSSHSPSSSESINRSLTSESEEYEKTLKDPSRTAGEINQTKKSIRIIAKPTETEKKKNDKEKESNEAIIQEIVEELSSPFVDLSDDPLDHSPTGRHSASPSLSLTESSSIFAVENLHSHLDPDERARITRESSVVSSPLVSPLSSSLDLQQEKRAIHRSQIIDEIRQSELNYVQSLQQLNSIYYQPMKGKLKEF
jgi:hypothetical protein